MRRLLQPTIIFFLVVSTACARPTPDPLPPSAPRAPTNTSAPPTATSLPPTPTLQPTATRPSHNDLTTGTIHCNEEAIDIRASIAWWELQTKTLTVLLFRLSLTDETVQYWTETYRSRSSATETGSPFRVEIYPTDKKYFAKLELTMKSTAIRGSQDNIQSYFFYIDCPTAQLNINRSIFTNDKRMMKDFPQFKGNLQFGGYLKFTMKEAEEFELVKTKSRWEIEVNTNLYTK